MSKILLAATLFGFLQVVSCTAQPSEKLLAPADFDKRYKGDTGALLLDVRTMNEVSRGYIAGASHIDFYNKQFKEQVNTIDKQRSVYVYCGSGARSAEAASIMREMGFASVYEMDGGLIAWKLQNLPLTTPLEQAASSDAIMSAEAFNGAMQTNPLVLVDFYAPWCAPCKIMKPALDSMITNMRDSVLILTLNADDHLHLMKSLSFNSIPQILLFKNGKEQLRQSGYMSRQDMEALVRRHY